MINCPLSCFFIRGQQILIQHGARVSFEYGSVHEYTNIRHKYRMMLSIQFVINRRIVNLLHHHCKQLTNNKVVRDRYTV